MPPTGSNEIQCTLASLGVWQTGPQLEPAANKSPQVQHTLAHQPGGQAAADLLGPETVAQLYRMAAAREYAHLGAAAAAAAHAPGSLVRGAPAGPAQDFGG